MHRSGVAPDRFRQTPISGMGYSAMTDFRQMIDCGPSRDHWVQMALEYLPDDVLEKHEEELVFIALGGQPAMRIAPQYRVREIVFLSDHIFPTSCSSPVDQPGRDFIFAVLHEAAHAIKRHGTRKFDGLSHEEALAQEAEADQFATHWFNQHVKKNDDQRLLPLSPSEIKEGKERRRRQVDALERSQKSWFDLEYGPSTAD